jgi:hypothetical protein
MCGAAAALMLASGCDLKGCSCSKPTNKAEAHRVHSDVEMLSEGERPRVELRVARWSGLRYRLVLESSGSAGIEGQPIVAVPTVTMTIETEVLRGSANPIEARHDAGLLTMIEERCTLTSLTTRHDATPKPIVDGWNLALLPLRGTTSRQKVAESAAVIWVGTELVGGLVPPEPVKKSLDAAFEAQRHFPFRLPPTSVGVGARWRFKEKLLVNGIETAQVADMSLRSVDPNTATVGLNVRQEAPAQIVPHPFAPGAKATLNLYRSDGDGELVVDRLTAIPLKGRLTSTAQLVLSDDITGAPRSAKAIWTSTITARGEILSESDAGVQEAP